MVALTLLLSSLVVVGVGVIVQSQITGRVLAAKQSAAIDTVKSTVTIVVNQLQNSSASSDDSTQRQSLQRAVDQIGIRRTGSGATTADNQGSAGSFEAVITQAAVGQNTIGVGPVSDVPADLQARVSAGYLALEYTRITRAQIDEPALVVGAVATVRTDRFQVYLIFPLTAEQATASLVQNTLLLGGIGLVLALVLIAVAVATQVVRPVRRAARVAGRLAAGDLGERMPVKGPVELTTLARSFNAMAEAIRAQITQLEEFSKLQRRFTSDVSHELRTPVTTVRMAADLLHSSRDELPGHLGRSTELLVEELDRFEILLADLLEISRFDAGMAELAAESMDVRSVVTEVVRAARPLALSARVDLQVLMPDHPVVADIDHRRVQRILRNLVNNALDHAEGRPVQVELDADETALAVAVTDHGVGLKPGEAGLVFNRFWRADTSRQRQTGGTGLGLAISLEDARLHGGWLQASGRPGVGSRFRLTLPLTAGATIDFSPLPLRTDGEDEEQPAPHHRFAAVGEPNELLTVAVADPVGRPAGETAAALAGHLEDR